MLYMGKGGGEFLFQLRPFPAYVPATERYKPNVLIAQKRLEPLGVEVNQINDEDQLPFEDDALDLVINKYESFDPSEVKRVLKAG